MQGLRRMPVLSEFANHRSRRAIENWLIHCADPLGPRTAAPRRKLSPDEGQVFVAQADSHGILPAALQNFPPFESDPAFAAARSEALARNRAKATYSLMLRAHGEALMSAAAGLPVVMVKGPVFSRTLYPLPRFRTFTDIDLLIAPDAEPPLARILQAQGFDPVDRDEQRQEWKWLHRDNGALMVEVHGNLVHHPEMRDAVSLRYEHLAGNAETPAGLLTVALVHGAMERYELLRHVVDVCQAARAVDTARDEARLETLVDRTGARLAAIAGLDLAARLLAEPRCRELSRGLGPARHSLLARALLGRSAIASTMGGERSLHSWRRQLFRALLKRGAASRSSTSAGASHQGDARR